MSASKRICPYCGNNPVNHTMLKLTESIDLILAPLYKQLNRLNDTAIDKLASAIVKNVAQPFRLFGLWKYYDDRMHTPTDRSAVIWEEAEKRGIKMQGISVLGKSIEHHRAHINGRWQYFESLPIPVHFQHSTFNWIDDKAVLRSTLQDKKIPVAGGGVARTLSQAHEIFSQYTPPYIVKPRVGSRGRHTTTHVYSKNELGKAFHIAKQLCSHIIIEEQLEGSVYRGTYVNGKIVGILRGDPPRIVGDGKSTIAKLIEEKNKAKHPSVSSIQINKTIIEFLRRQKYSLSTIPKKNQFIDLSEKIGIAYGGFSAEVFPHTHPKTIKYLEDAGKHVGCVVVGFDFIIKDITVDPDTQKWGIVEANSLPFIDLHHFPLEGKPINVASIIWDLWKQPKKRMDSPVSTRKHS